MKIWAGICAAAWMMASTVVAQAAGFTSITDLKVATDLAHSLKADKSKRVLVVFDIDDTLLTVPGDLGSEGWLGGKLDEAKGEQRDVILYEQTLWLTLAGLKPTQDDGPQRVRDLQSAGIPVYTLSARGSELRGATERALMAVGYDFSMAPECVKPLCTRRGRLGDDEIRKAAQKLKVALPEGPHRDITVSDGIMLAAGQDKGEMVQLLAASIAKKPFTDIVFVDDSRRNIDDVVRAATTTSKITFHVFRYEKIWPRNVDLHDNPARLKAADAQSDAIRASLCAAFDSVLCGYSYGFGN